MDALECIRKRREVREYKDVGVPDEVIEKVLEAGRLASSGMNLQPWYFVVVRSRESLRELGASTHTGAFIKDASFAVAVLTDPSNHWHMVDGVRAVQNMALAAWALGVGTCFVGNFDQERVKMFLNAPGNLSLLTVLPFGYPKVLETRRKKIRKKFEEVVFSEKFGRPFSRNLT